MDHENGKTGRIDFSAGDADGQRDSRIKVAAWQPENGGNVLAGPMTMAGTAMAIIEVPKRAMAALF